MAGTVWLIAVAVALVVTAAIVLNWVDPNPGVFISDVGAGAAALYELVVGAIQDRLSEVAGA